jgi:hypothetical protein
MNETFEDWLRNQVRAEGPDDCGPDYVETTINAFTNVELIHYFALYQTMNA